jgi:DNA-binding NtrC family response regulator
VERSEPREKFRGLKGLVIDHDLNMVTLTSKYLNREGGEMKTATDIDSVTNPLIEKPFQLSELKEEIVKVISRDGVITPARAGRREG